MSDPAQRQATYEDLYGIPENTIGEIIDGELIVSPRPSRKHGYAATTLVEEMGPAYHRGRGGPGGWIFITEPEIQLGEHTLVPDLAGWKNERFPREEEQNAISVPPDWICEILSPGTVRNDRVRKMPKYAKFEVQYIWLIEPIAKTLEAFRLEAGRWVLLGFYTENDKVRSEPFHELEFNLGDLWLE